jgi:hypothetical protein
MKDEVRTAISARLCAFLFSAFILLPSSLAMADRQDDVLKGISSGVGQKVDGGKVVAAFLMVAAVILVLVIVNYSRQRTITPKVLNHPGKLLKEVARGINLKPAEIKQLKALAEGQELSSPLVLLLCPSIMIKAAKIKGDKIDKRVIANLTRRLRGSESPDGTASNRTAATAAR